MGRFIAEPLGEQPIGSEGSSRPALRTYFVGVNFTGTPVYISELSGECWGGELVLGLAVRRCLRPRRCVRRRGVRSGHTEQCQSTRLRIQTPGLCTSGFSRCCRRYCFRGPCTCIRWGGACIRRGAPAFSMRSPSRQLGVHQGAVNCMS